MTFSIVAWDPMTRMTGIAVATKHLAVGALVPHAKTAVGAIATQGQTNPLLGICGLQLLEQQTLCERSTGKIPVSEIIHLLLQDDEDRHQRQLHLVNCHGRTAAWTGQNCVDWAGHLTFPYFSVAGNMLVGEQTLTAMADAYQAKEGMEFCERLLQALEAGEAAGGDKRGRQSAALYVVHQDIFPHLDLRVDHHDNPIAELRYLFDESRKEYYQLFRQAIRARRMTNSKPTVQDKAIRPVWKNAMTVGVGEAARVRPSAARVSSPNPRAQVEGSPNSSPKEIARPLDVGQSETIAPVV